ncbi:hypothetical protein A2U01_0000883 [Trifolium medium]|uniref:Uncharacterized protein n=1 Tax=Trifolium medium TaxID=97028 RepID=A0A392LYR1_9FABA|nr:hypothetical protein [Trifolium medium]
MYINGDAGGGKLAACRKIGGNYMKVKFMRERGITGKRGEFEGKIEVGEGHVSVVD